MPEYLLVSPQGSRSSRKGDGRTLSTETTYAVDWTRRVSSSWGVIYNIVVRRGSYVRYGWGFAIALRPRSCNE